ncbi:MAG: class I mannose-6-phosphate isomerase [Opitutae bacterium]|jgi:mannose-6-phosphate isomerase|nr:class I mannose-6-phosphate isomerase [Opitutae bacterium]MBT5378261.1 class I mannose-6-phosphate isomerase [Opitutae bacterium]MBT5690329.1 class I mannose-6-phosphate isomerase [Opitutae bacterium]MBT6462494.1 class I mannose-6-phosphate isomerase [Opitutae bacterium]MBT7852333.1 class I mannose-6-phosphate isomerase [Opitutae bacterium]
MEDRNKLTFLKFRPVYMDRVWGGTGLKTLLGRDLPENRTIGESWEIVDRQEAQSEIANGPLAGMTLRKALKSHCEALMGPGWDSSKPFPVLVKWLDCHQRLSLQVHPPVTVANDLGGEPKTENWFVASAEPGASLIVGLKEGVTRNTFEEALQSGQLEDCVHSFDVCPGDSLLVESGRLHAIDAGNLILEIQQNSDTTYRVYDWGRIGLEGKPRQLHVEESLHCIDFSDYEPEPLRFPVDTGKKELLADCKEFRITRYLLESVTGRLKWSAYEDVRLLHIVSGSLLEVGTGAILGRGDNVLLPFSAEIDFVAEKDALVLVTDRFC